MTPEIQYAKSGDVHIAQQTFGQGAENIVIIPGFVSYREHLPSFRFRSSGGAGPSVGGMQTRACPLRQLREAAEGRFRIYRVRRMPRLRVGSCDRRHNLPFEYPLFFGRRVTNGLPCVAGPTQERNSSGPRLEVNDTLFLSSDQRGYDRRWGVVVFTTLLRVVAVLAVLLVSGIEVFS